MALRSSKIETETINPFKKNFNKGDINKNRIRDVIISSFELSQRTQVPILWFSNPGYGKTTTVYNIAKKKGMHVESLCASQYSQDELLGFQTNEPGSANLIIKEPEWYSRIIQMHKQGKASILFLDEMGTVSGPNQGALLQLIFERRIRGGKALPDDCVVVSASNYKGNLPGYSEIIAPNLNRFCIINLIPENPKELIEEFTQGIGETQDEWPEFRNNVFDDKQTNYVITKVRKTMETLFTTYNSPTCNKGFLNIANTLYDGIYDRDDGNPNVLNFISGRSISNLIKCIIGLASMGLDSTSDLYQKVIYGLIGLGTNTWSEQGDMEEASQRLEAYLKDVTSRFANILDDANGFFKNTESTANNETLSQLNKLMGTDTVSNRITAFVANHDEEKYFTEEWADLFKKICENYNFDKFEDNIKRCCSTPENIMLFRSDMDCLETLLADADRSDKLIGNLRPYLMELTKMHKAYKFYYNACALTL